MVNALAGGAPNERSGPTDRTLIAFLAGLGAGLLIAELRRRPGKNWVETETHGLTVRRDGNGHFLVTGASKELERTITQAILNAGLTVRPG